VKDIPGADKFPEPADLFDITKFGGWEEVNVDFFDPENGVVARIFQDQGKSTASG
jgi:ABC-type sulfate transport system substrate-binding protein